ncbi:MAG: rhodanese-like domain-containing protein [Acidobacteriia bacterium]|nr:rhodanese-like domain-containing protein [Methyloceanibacter sp.]MBX5470984.1 rhodanese-like domain-containing protein [Acetobacteraceae bacterium]MCL6491921.1 rhodanese-like domain-containing protein [Terriglobia bacterium]
MLKGLFHRPKVVELTPLEVHEKACCGEAILIDVRERHEYAQECIPGAELVPLSSFDPQALPNLYGQTLVLYCASGSRSAHAVSRCLRAGITAVANMRGGIWAWKAAGLPTESRTKQTKRS